MIEDSMTRYLKRIVIAIVTISMSLMIIPASDAQVIEQNPWDNLTWPGWYIGSGSHFIDSNSGTPNPTNALRFTFPAGMQEGGGPGIAEYGFGSRSEIYTGYWFKFSPNFEWNLTLTKISFAWQTNSNLVHDGITPSQKYTMRLPPEGKIIRCNVGSNPTIQTGQWYWVEWHINLNGIFKSWINDEPCHDFTNVPYPQANFYVWQHSATWGGCCTAVKTQTDYLWVDQTTFATSRIGMPGGTPSPDTTPPAPPTNLTVTER